MKMSISALFQPMPTTAVVLAGGLGTRLRSVLSDRPKVLALVDGRPFLWYLLRYLAIQGIEHVVLCTGYLGDQVRAFAKDGYQWGLKISYSHESSPLGTGGALRQASEQITGPFFSLNGDTVFMSGLQKLWHTHFTRHATATLALLRVREVKSRGSVTIDDAGSILHFHEKPSSSETALVNTGFYVLTREALASIPPGQPASLECEIFPLLAKQRSLQGDIETGYFADIGTPEALVLFEQDVLAGIVPILKTDL